MTVSTRAATVFKLEKQLKITPLASNGDCDDDDDNDE
jgi:hypothetical protein